ncbi:SLATT domain-containing protein [Vibrio splendidus]
MDEKAEAYAASLENQIWFTRKTRIRTSERLLSNKFHSNLILVWYSFFSFSLSIYLIKSPDYFGGDADVIMTILTGSVFTLSLFVPQLNLSSRYEKIKENYISMQDLLFSLKLCNSVCELKEVHNQYTKLLHSVENHTNLDFHYFLNYDSGLDCTIKISKTDWLRLQCYLMFRMIFIMIAYLVPVLFLVCIV